jgi:ribosomal protein L24E
MSSNQRLCYFCGDSIDTGWAVIKMAARRRSKSFFHVHTKCIPMFLEKNADDDNEQNPIYLVTVIEKEVS